MKLLPVALLAVILSGCASAPQQLPPRAQRAYKYVFYGWHRKLAPWEDTRARRLFQNYIDAEVKWEEAESCPCSCNYNDMPYWDAKEKAQFEVWDFVDTVK